MPNKDYTSQKVIKALILQAEKDLHVSLEGNNDEGYWGTQGRIAAYKHVLWMMENGWPELESQGSVPESAP